MIRKIQYPDKEHTTSITHDLKCNIFILNILPLFKFIKYFIKNKKLYFKDLTHEIQSVYISSLYC